jgi:hypothetical protein
VSTFEVVSLMIGAGLVQGLLTWGAMRVEVRYLRRDTDRAHWRLDNLPCGGQARRVTDFNEGGKCNG